MGTNLLQYPRALSLYLSLSLSHSHNTVADIVVLMQGDKTFWLRSDVVKKGKPQYLIKALQQKYPNLQNLTLIDDIGLSNTLVEVDKLLVRIRHPSAAR